MLVVQIPLARRAASDTINRQSPAAVAMRDTTPPPVGRSEKTVQKGSAMNIRRVILLAAYAITTCVFYAASFDIASCRAAEHSASPATGAVYDFFDYARYPVEGKLRPWVELRKVTTPTDTNPKEYAPRRVQWWPRKGIDYTELRKGMIGREWTLSASALDPEYKPVRFGGLETKEHDVLEFTWFAGEGFLRRVRGFVTPKESGNYTFKISANDEGYILLSPNDKPADARVICHLSHWTKNVQWATASQTSKPQKLEAGKKAVILRPINLVRFVQISGSYFGSACSTKEISFRMTLNGTEIQQYGRKKIPFEVSGTKRSGSMDFMVTDVTKPLAAVSAIVDAGNKVSSARRAVTSRMRLPARRFISNAREALYHGCLH